MCVIAIVRKDRPTKQQVELMHKTNSHGGGVAWEEDGAIRWEKGLDLEGMIKKCEELPTPFIAHFRIPTSGTSKEPGVCHPFPVDEGVSTSLEGSSKNGVLFHNGHWNMWKSRVEAIAVGRGVRIPDGQWSDTRGLAFMAHYLGNFSLDMSGEKIAVMRPGGKIEIFGESEGWSKVDGIKGMVVSNLLWRRASSPDPNPPLSYASYLLGGRKKEKPSSLFTNSKSTTEEVRPFWEGPPSKYLNTPQRVEAALKTLEGWRASRIIQPGPFRKTRAMLKAQLKNLNTPPPQL